MRVRTIKNLKFLLIGMALVGISGCARIQKYSIESYHGPFPLHDRAYIALDGE